MAKTNIFHFFAPINPKTVSTLIDQMLTGLNYQDDNRANKILIKFSSGGGDLQSGFTLYNFIRSISPRVPISIVNMGDIDSIAVICYLAVDTRLVVPNSRFLLHDFHWNFSAGSVDHSRLTEHVASLDFDVKRYCDIFKERTKGAKSAIDINKHLHGVPLLVDATAAMDCGIAHKTAHPKDTFVDGALDWWVNV